RATAPAAGDPQLNDDGSRAPDHGERGLARGFLEPGWRGGTGLAVVAGAGIVGGAVGVAGRAVGVILGVGVHVGVALRVGVGVGVVAVRVGGSVVAGVRGLARAGVIRAEGREGQQRHRIGRAGERRARALAGLRRRRRGRVGIGRR